MKKITIAIDGFSSTGKSTLAKQLAKKLQYIYVDTGAMYRAVTWAAIERGIDLSDQAALAELARSIEVRFDGDQVFVDGQNVTTEIRVAKVTRNVVSIADAESVREHLVQLQRNIAIEKDFVCEGRDQGTVAFPDAFCKIYLTASDSYRAKRRVEQPERAQFDTPAMFATVTQYFEEPTAVEGLNLENILRSV